jgi:hypothetical protein
MKLTPVANSSKIKIDTGVPAIGRILLWVPEGVSSETGVCAVYPVGTWEEAGGALVQNLSGEPTIGPGNIPRIDADTFECNGIRIPADCPVGWRAQVAAGERSVEFSLEVTNLGGSVIRKAGAAICCKFLDAGWWADEHVFVSVAGEPTPLSALGREAGKGKPFQAYLLEGESFDQVFYREFWGFNPQRIDRPVIISEHTGAGWCAGIESEWAYFMHSNKGNPCTDMKLAFGDIEPGGAAEAKGTVWIREGEARTLMGESS